MHPRVRIAHDALWKRFFCDQTSLIYDVVFTDPSQFPTPEEVAASHPSCAGWGTGMEDCCLTGGFVLDGLVSAHRVTGDAEWAGKARKVFRGLSALATASGLPGFIARGFAPGRSDVYPNSSADQYTAFVFGVWNYARSPIASEPERAQASQYLVSIARLVESFHDDIPRRDMRPSIYGDTSAITADRACRILMFYMAAHDISGDPHWDTRYREKVEEDGRARLQCHYGPQEWDRRRNLHCVNQSQAAFRLLYETETDPAIKDAYRRALQAQATCVLHRIPLWREKVRQPRGKALPPRWREPFAAFLREHPNYDPSRHEEVTKWHQFHRDHAKHFPPTAEMLAKAPPALPWLRHQTEALGTVMLSDDPGLKREAAKDAWPMLTEVEWCHVAEAGVWECLELGYWRGVEDGVFPRD